MHGVATTNASTMTRTIAPMRFAERSSSFSRARATTNARASRGGDEGGGKRVTKASEELAEKFTTGGGGADGFCDYDDIRDAMEQCDGLEGAKLDACYAAYGCNLDAVTDHYAKAAGIEAQKKTK